MTRLSDVATGRDNNLNLIRMLAAVAVLVSHAYPIALGPDTKQPLEKFTGHTLGYLAVVVFFIISGFLIAESYVRAKTRIDFLIARGLRLWPALLLSITLVAFVMGPLTTTLAPATYIAHPDTWAFLIRNTLLANPQYTLPGVFETQPYPNVEGSIWTLFYEVVCYMGIFVAGVLGLLGKRLWLTLGILGVVGIYTAVEILSPDLPKRVSNLLSLALPFSMGMLFWRWKDRLVLHVGGMVALTGLTISLATTSFYDVALIVCLAYAIFWFAYIPRGAVLVYNRLGDYSYGVYIYAFPAQGLALWLTGGETMPPLLNIAIALPLTLVPSVLSWYLIEKPALGLRKRIAARWLKTTSP